MCGGMYSSPTPSLAALGVGRGGLPGRLMVKHTPRKRRSLLRLGSLLWQAPFRPLVTRGWLNLGGKLDGHGDNMGELENAATRYAVTVVLGLMGLGAGLALLGVWLTRRNWDGESAGK